MGLGKKLKKGLKSISNTIDRSFSGLGDRVQEVAKGYEDLTLRGESSGIREAGRGLLGGTEDVLRATQKPIADAGQRLIGYKSDEQKRQEQEARRLQMIKSAQDQGEDFYNDFLFAQNEGYDVEGALNITSERQNQKKEKSRAEKKQSLLSFNYFNPQTKRIKNALNSIYGRSAFGSIENL